MDKLNELQMSQGWGADRRKEDRPGHPKEKSSDGKMGARWAEPEQQIQRVKIHKTIERPHITPVFGTACPPKGLSGKIRDFAYRYSENQLKHWMLLLFADRVDVVEGMIDDIRKGKFPHLISEMGLRSELSNSEIKHRFSRTRAKGGPTSRGLYAAAAIAVGVGYFFWRQNYSRNLSRT